MKFLSDILAKAGLTVDGVVTLNNTATGQTPDANDNSTKLATTAWVRTFVQPYSLPIASASVLGGVKVGSGLSIDSGTGVLSVTGASAATIKSTQTFVVTEGQTVFTVTGGYTPGLIDIFLNGVYLSPNQTVATNGTTFTINDPAAAGDIVDVIVASPIFEGATTTTDQLPEGVVNLYYTNARARAAISLTTTGVSGAATYDNITGVFNIPNYQGLVPAGGIAGDILAKVSGTNYDVTWIPNYTSQVQHIVKAGVAVTKGQAVYVSSADGTNMIVSKASNASEGTSSKTLGLVAQSMAINDQGFVVTEGLLAGLDTSTANAGDPVWLGTDGNLIFGLVNKPYAPAHLVFIGVVTRVQSNNGEIFVKVQNGFELDELHDLSVKNASDGDMIKYVASTGLWTKIAATTTNITEGTNLYYTTARANSDFDTRLATKSTTNLTEGTNLYYTDTRVGTYLTANSYATQSYVSTQINNLVSGAPGLLDTLDELAAALGDDPNFATTVSTALSNRLRIDIGTQGLTSTQQGYGRTNLGLGSLAVLSSVANAQITDVAWSKVTGAPAFITGYTEVDTLASVTGRGASTTTTLNLAKVVTTGLYGPGTSAEIIPIWQYNSGNPGYGIAYEESSPDKFRIDVSGSLMSGTPDFEVIPNAVRINGNTAWHEGNLTNLNQLTNGPGYITSYTETDTLATVTGRGASTSTNVTFNGNVNANGTYLNVAGYIDLSSTLYLRGNVNYLNAASNGWNTFLARNGERFDGYFANTYNSGVLQVIGSSTFDGTVTFTSSYSGDSADYTGISNPSYKVSPTSGYWRVVYLSNNSTVSGVYNFQTGKNVYWGEPDDTGGYYFRGRTLYTNGSAVIHAGNIGLQSVNYANSAGAIAWSNVSAGYRENYDLGFRPPNSSSSYAGFRFATVGNDADAGYLLVRGGADNDVYTQGGITLVADAGWLTLAQRTSLSKGVRIMTGSSTSVTRLEIATTGMTTINSGLVVTSGLAWNDGTPALTVGGSGDARLQVRHIWGKDAGSSGKDHLWLNYSTGGNHVQIGSSGEGNNLYVAGTVYVGGYFTGNAVVHAGNIGSQSVSYASSAGSSHGMPYDGNAISGMGPISNWDTRPGVGQAGFGINWHTGVTISGYAGYGGVRLYASGYPTHSGSVLRLEASGAVYTYGGLYSDNNLVLHAGNYTSYALSTSGGSVNGSVKITSSNNDASGFTNSDLGNAFYTDRGGRLLTSNGANWASDGRDPALVISGSYSNTDRGRIGLAFHNETTANNAFAPMIAFSTRSQSGSYNTVYASIMGRYTGYNTGVDTNWASGELHFYAHGSAYVDDTPTMKLTGAGFLQVASGGGSSTATFSLLQTGYSNAYFQYNTGKLQIGGDSGLSDGIYFNMYNGSSYGDRFVIKPNGRVNIISGGRTLSLGDGNYSNHILVDSNVDFAFNYNNGSTGGFGFFGGTGSAKFMCSYTGTLTVSGDVVAYGSPSDARLKDIKEKVPNALDSILKLNGYRFDWKEKELDVYGDDKKILHIKEDIGVIAQEVADVLPELAKINEDGFMSVRYQGLTAVLIEAVKEQQLQIESQKSEIEELKDLVKQLINR